MSAMREADTEHHAFPLSQLCLSYVCGKLLAYYNLPDLFQNRGSDEEILLVL